MESKTLKLVTVVTLQVLAAVLVSCVAVCNATKFEKTGKINFKHASFVEVERVSDHDILLATNFQPFGPGKVCDSTQEQNKGISILILISNLFFSSLNRFLIVIVSCPTA